MRHFKLILCLVFLPYLAFADSNYYLGASGVPAATCSSTIQENTTAATQTPFNNGTRVYGAASFTASSNYTIYHTIVRLRRLGDGSVGGTGNTNLYICTDNAGAPSATCQVFDTNVAISAVSTVGGLKTFDLAAGYAVTNGTRYWLKYAATVAGDADDYLQHYYNTAGSEIVAWGDATPTWTNADAFALGYFSNSNCE